ncbi:hypothetical protein JQ035_00560 [Clostridium botulinum]|nr:hypothetical protein [Clostridium botulinum]
MINNVFFSKFLNSNYFTEPKDMNINDNNLKETYYFPEEPYLIGFIREMILLYGKYLNIVV